MKSQGWQFKLGVITVSVIALFTTATVFASSLTVRDIQLQGGGAARIILDGVPPRGSVNLEYVRDIVQFSLQNSTIYPAKILHADGNPVQAFNKVFAYQYAPNLVRIRFSVEGRADLYQGKVKVETKGKSIEITFPEPIAANSGNKEANGKEVSDAKEQSLLAKVLGRGKTEGVQENETTENVKQADRVENRVENRLENRVEKNDRPEKGEGAEKTERTEKSEKTKLRLGSSVKSVELGGKSQGPSVFRSFLAMFLVVGGLGLFLVYLKKKKGASQAKRVGDSWISNLLAGGKKQKAYIEVLANHALGPKQSITVVRIKDQQFVLGVTQDSVQLITQLDSDEADLDLLDDPKVADSIGKMFGSQVTQSPSLARAPKTNASLKVDPQVIPGASFDTLLKGSNGAGAIVARNAYQASASSSVQNPLPQSGVRDQIRRRLQGMGNV